jgi:hypothetical protein
MAHNVVFAAEESGMTAFFGPAAGTARAGAESGDLTARMNEQ